MPNFDVNIRATDRSGFKNLDKMSPQQRKDWDAAYGPKNRALAQAKLFHEQIELDSISLTKLDGTAKGGILFALATALGLPIRFIGVGESARDLRPFDAGTFINAILPIE